MFTIAEGMAFSPIQDMGEGETFLLFNEENLVTGGLFSNIQRQEKRLLSRSKIFYGLFDQETVPFLVFRIKRVIETVHTINPFYLINRKFNPLDDEILSFVLLCEFPTKEVKAMRPFKIKSEILLQFIEKTIQAKEKLKDNFEAESIRILSENSNSDMANGTSMHLGMCSGTPNLKYYSY